MTISGSKGLLKRLISTEANYNCDHLFELATQFNAKVQTNRAHKLDAINSTISQLQTCSPANSEELTMMREKKERLVYNQHKMNRSCFQPPEQLSSPIFNVPFMHQLDSTQWNASQGKELLTKGLKVFGLIDEIFSEQDFKSVCCNLYVEYEPLPVGTAACPNPINVARRGNLIYPWITLKPPRLVRCLLGNELREPSYSLLLVDCDYPDEAVGRKVIFCHWFIDDLKGMEREINFNSGKEIMPYIAPHPFRGTEYHRYAFMLLSDATSNSEFESECSERTLKTSLFESLAPPNTAHSLGARVLNLKALLQQKKIVGFSFFRTTWSKHIGNYLEQELALRDPVFGTPSEIFNRKTQTELGNMYKYC